MKRMFSFAVAPLVVLVLSATGCSTTRPVETQVSDEAMEKRIEGKIATDMHINPFNVSVEVQEGVAYLTGRVPSEGERQTAEQYARDTSGIKSVRNMIQVGTLQ